MNRILAHLLSSPLATGPLESLDAWWDSYRAVAEAWAEPIDRALAGGFGADRLGWAFASGYQAAMGALFGDATRGRPAALCATEEGGAHPRAIETSLRRDADRALHLEGSKRFVTLGAFAERLMVVASEGTAADGTNRLRVVALPRERGGVTVEPGPATPFVPEVPHARLLLQDVDVRPAEVLPGDGYTRYLKPFRTVEDIHVNAACVGWLVRVGREADWPAEVVESLLGVALGLRGLAGADPSDATTHVALAGVLRLVEGVIERAEPLWAQAGALHRDRWERDRPLLQVAAKARARRRQTAWHRLGVEVGSGA